MTVTVTSEASDLMWIHLSELKWVSNEALINLALSASKAFFAVSVSAKDNLHSSFFTFLINSCKSVTILK